MSFEDLTRPDRFRPALSAGIAGLVFVGLEALLARLAPAPLDAAVPAVEVLGAATLLGLLLGLVVLLGGRRWGLLAATLLWTLVWAFEGPRSADLPLILGMLPVALIVGAGLRWPRLALWIAVLGASWVPLLRLRAEQLPLPDSIPRGPDILLVTVDTVRADAGLLDGIATGSWQRFDRAVSAAPWTLPAMHSLMLAEPVQVHGAGLPGGGSYSQPLPGQERWVEQLRQRGYATIALLSNPHLDTSFGFQQGFSRWVHSDRAREPLLLLHNLDGLRARLGLGLERRKLLRDDRLLEAALAEIARPSDRPRFVWVHFLSPHEYGRSAEDPPRGWYPGTRDPEILRAAYAGNIAATRERLQRLVEGAANWTIAITSDHGEALGEGGHFGHGRSLADPELRVPLAVRVPGQPGAQSLEQVAVYDLGPALLAHALHGGPVILRHRAAVPVGGTRRERRLAIRLADGLYVPVEDSQPAGPAVEVPASTRAALEALGYLD